VGWLTQEVVGAVFFKRSWGAVMTTVPRPPRHPPGPRAPPPPVKEAWLVRLVGPGCIRYRECTQVHNIYTVYIYIYISGWDSLEIMLDYLCKFYLYILEVDY
jgi:hypothetical protein